MKIFYSKYFPPKGFAAINLFGIIIGRKEYGYLNDYELNHEEIHTKQMIELLGVVFYVLYFAEWLFRLLQYRNRLVAYYNISFEREAYKNGNNLDYLRERKLFSFRHYYRLKKNE